MGSSVGCSVGSSVGSSVGYSMKCSMGMNIFKHLTITDTPKLRKTIKITNYIHVFCHPQHRWPNAGRWYICWITLSLSLSCWLLMKYQVSDSCCPCVRLYV